MDTPPRTTSRRRARRPVRRCRLPVLLAVLLLISVPASAQRTSPPSSPYPPAVTQRAPSGMPSPRRLPTPRIPSAASVRRYVRHPRVLLRRNAFSARIRSLAPATAVPNPFYQPSQAAVDAAVTKMSTADMKQAKAYSDLMLNRIAIRRRQELADGWAYFHRGDYMRAEAAFEAAATVAPDDPTACFGQLMAVVANRQHIRALHKLAELARLDERRRAGVAGLFEYPFSLTDAFVSPEQLRVMLDGLREFTQNNPDKVQVQALHCLVLWYVRSDDAAIEARSIAARIRRTHPRSPWARFGAMMEAARPRVTEKQASS